MVCQGYKPVFTKCFLSFALKKMRFSGSANNSRWGDLPLCAVAFSRLLGILCYRISWHVTEFLVCELPGLTTRGHLSPLARPPVGLLGSWSSSASERVGCVASEHFFTAVCSCGLTLEGSVQLLLAPELVTFPKFSFTPSCHRTKSQRHVLTPPRCQEDPSPAGPYDPNEWAAICTVN